MRHVDEKTKEVIDDTSDKAEQAIGSVAERATEMTQRARAAAHGAVDDSRDAVEHAVACAKGMVRANPFLSIAIVAAVAYLWGRMRA